MCIHVQNRAVITCAVRMVSGGGGRRVECSATCGTQSQFTMDAARHRRKSHSNSNSRAASVMRRPLQPQDVTLGKYIGAQYRVHVQYMAWRLILHIWDECSCRNGREERRSRRAERRGAERKTKHNGHVKIEKENGRCRGRGWGWAGHLLAFTCTHTSTNRAPTGSNARQESPAPLSSRVARCTSPLRCDTTCAVRCSAVLIAEAGGRPKRIWNMIWTWKSKKCYIRVLTYIESPSTVCVCVPSSTPHSSSSSHLHARVRTLSCSCADSQSVARVKLAARCAHFLALPSIMSR